MGWVLPVAMVAMSAIGTGLSIAGNIKAKKTADRQAGQALRSNDAQIRVAENTGTLQAQQQSSERTRRYNDVISSQTAIWASRGVQLQSGTVRNVADQSAEAYGRDIGTIELNRMNRLASLALYSSDVAYGTANAMSAAQTRMTSGITQSLLSFGNTAISAGSMAFGGPAGSSSSSYQPPPAYGTPGTSSGGMITSGIRPVSI